MTFSPETLAARQAKPVALVDLDDTVYQGLLMKDLIDQQITDKVLSKATLPWIVEEICKYHNGHKGKPANVTLLNEQWAHACSGIPYIELLDHAINFMRSDKARFQPYAQPVLDMLKERGYDIWLITGEPQFVAKAVIDRFGGTGFCSTRWEIDEHLNVTGKVEDPMISERKRYCAEILFNQEAVLYDRRRSLAFIDSVNDRGLADAVPLSIVCCGASPELVDYLLRNNKPHVITSPDNIVKYVDELTKRI